MQKESRLRRLIRNQRGNVLIEFVLGLTVLSLLAMGVIEFGFLYQTQVVLDNGAREGARVAATGGSASVIQTAVDGAVADLNTANVTLTTSVGPGPDGLMATVELGYPVTINTPIIAQFFPSTVVLQSMTSMRLE